MSEQQFKYDYIVVGRWRNRDQVNAVKQALRDAGKRVYCFTDHSYEGDGIKFDAQDANIEAGMAAMESLTDWQTNPTFRQIFENDMNGLKNAKALIMVLPAGVSAHTELGVAYGMGKKCYGIGVPEKPETLYLIFDAIYPDIKTFLEQVA